MHLTNSATKPVLATINIADGAGHLVCEGDEITIKGVIVDARGVSSAPIRAKIGLGENNGIVHLHPTEIATYTAVPPVAQATAPASRLDDPAILGGDIVEVVRGYQLGDYELAPGAVLTVDHRDHAGLPVFGFGLGERGWPVDCFRLIGQRRRDGSGWFDWHGGPNPAPGKRVEVKKRSGIVFDNASDGLFWSHATPAYHTDIIAFRQTSACTARKNDHDSAKSARTEAALDAQGIADLEAGRSVPAEAAKEMLREYASGELPRPKGQSPAETRAASKRAVDNGIVWIREGDSVTIEATVIREPGACGEFLTARIGDKHDGKPFDIQVRITDLASHHPRKLQVEDIVHRVGRSTAGRLVSIFEDGSDSWGVVRFGAGVPVVVELCDLKRAPPT